MGGSVGIAGRKTETRSSKTPLSQNKFSANMAAVCGSYLLWWVGGLWLLSACLSSFPSCQFWAFW